VIFKKEEAKRKFKETSITETKEDLVDFLEKEQVPKEIIENIKAI